jgi:glycosyltransferase involved in cell wall biosynthesis
MHDGPLKLLFVGGDYKRKGGDLLRDVVETKLDGACELHMVTADALPNSERVFVYNGVKPHSPELLRLYQECDVFVLPTRGDCLAVVLGEAMASSLPIITTHVGAHAEAVEDGKSGFVIEMDDAEALTDRLRRLAADRRLVASMGARSREVGESRFDLAKGAATIAQILRELGQARGERRSAIEPLAEHAS